MSETPENYRFSGYNLPMLQLDSTGPSYYHIPTPHPYYQHQPAYYQKPMGWGAPAPCIIASTVTPPARLPKGVEKKGGLYPLQ